MQYSEPVKTALTYEDIAASKFSLPAFKFLNKLIQNFAIPVADYINIYYIIVLTYEIRDRLLCEAMKPAADGIEVLVSM